MATSLTGATQVDTLILRPGVEQFLGFDFVGAPWHVGNERWAGLVRDMLPAGVGNGGFSIRGVGASLAVVRAFGAGSPDHEQEDLFFASSMRRMGFNVANRSVAYAFCLEVPCLDVGPPGDHFALHAAWYYTPRHLLHRMLDDSLKYI